MREHFVQTLAHQSTLLTRSWSVNKVLMNLIDPMIALTDFPKLPIALCFFQCGKFILKLGFVVVREPGFQWE